MVTWDDIDCTAPVNVATRKDKCTLTLRSSATFYYKYTPKDGETLKQAAMHMEEHCLQHKKCNPKIRGPIKVMQHLFVDKINIRGTRYFRDLTTIKD